MKKTIVYFLLTFFLLTSCKVEESWFEPVISFYLDKNSLNMNVGNTETLRLTILPILISDRTVTWSSSNSDIVTVNNGRIRAVSPGNAVITAYLESGENTSCAVNVASGINAVVTEIDITKMPDKLMYLLGDNLDISGLIVTVLYSDGVSANAFITGENITGFDSSALGEKTLTITYSGKTTSFTVAVIEILEIEISSEPVKKSYNTGEPLDITGLVVTASYFDGAEIKNTPIFIANDYISGFSSLTPGTVNVTITYGSLTAEFTVTIIGIAGIEILEYPEKTNYRTGELLSLDGLEVRASYTAGGSYIVENSHLIVTGFDSFTSGEKTVTISFGGASAQFTVTVIGVSGITIDALPAKTVYKIGDILDITGIEATALYSDGIEESVTITAANITGFNSNTAGAKTIYVNYGGAQDSFTITVTALFAIELNRNPNKTNYKIGETLDITGIEVNAIYSFDDVKLKEIIFITSANITGFDSSSSGVKNLNVMFRNLTASFSVTVLNISSISITPSIKSVYKIGDDLDITGITATAVYTDGSTGDVPVALSNITGFNSMTAGVKTLTITIGGKTAQFTVTVVEIDSLTVTRQPVKTEYKIGEPLVISGIEVQAVYSYLSTSLTETVHITNANIIGYNSSTAGVKTLTIIYSGKTAVFSVTVIKEVTEINVTRLPNKKQYVLSEALNIAGIEVTAFYDDNSTGVVPITSSNITGFNSAVLGEQNLTVTYSGKTDTFTIIIGQNQGFNITFEQLIDEAPVLSLGVIIYLNTGSKTASLTVTNPSQYSSIVWTVPGTASTGNGASFTLDSDNRYYNRIGKHFIMVEVIKSGVPYSTTVEFEVRD